MCGGSNKVKTLKFDPEFIFNGINLKNQEATLQSKITLASILELKSVTRFHIHVAVRVHVFFFRPSGGAGGGVFVLRVCLY